MKKPALRRARKTTLLFVIAALLFLAGLAGTTLGYFDGETDNVATWSGGFVFPPTNATTVGGPVGAGQTITWTTPTTTGVQNYVLRVTNMGTTAVACPAQSVVTTTVTMPTTTQAGTVTWPTTYPETVGTLAAPAGSGVATIPSTDNGQFVCYQVAQRGTPRIRTPTQPLSVPVSGRPPLRRRTTPQPVRSRRPTRSRSPTTRT
jgi:hypothetical protein